VAGQNRRSRSLQAKEEARIFAAATFNHLDTTNLSQPIKTFSSTSLGNLGVEAACKKVFDGMVAAIQAHYPNKFLAVLFKNPTMSKHVFDLSK
jgi:hypothetical protein